MLNILTVDDSRFIRELLRVTLASAGHNVIQAADGQEALDTLDTIDDLDLIITDINMPRMDGFGLIGGVRELPRFRGTPILVLSTEGGAEKKARARAAGASGWIMKPFDAEALMRAVRRVADG